jgi:hypothetical protein
MKAKFKTLLRDYEVNPTLELHNKIEELIAQENVELTDKEFRILYEGFGY